MFRLCEIVPDTVSILRDAEFDRTGFASARTGQVLCCAAAPKYLRTALGSPAVTAVVTTPALAAEVPETLGLIVDDDPEIAFYLLHNHLARQHGMRTEVAHEVDPSAVIDPSALIENGCRIGPGVHVEAGAFVMRGTVLEAGVTVRVGAMIGVAGRFAKRRPGLLLQVEQVGGVHVGRDAEIEAGAIVQREVHPNFTRIGERVILGNRSTVSHGTIVGDDSTIAVGAMVCGYVTLGSRSWIGPAAVVSDSLEIGTNARVEIGSVVVRDVPDGERWSGLFAGPHRAMLRLGVQVSGTARGTKSETPPA